MAVVWTEVPETPTAIPYGESVSGNTVRYGRRRFVPVPAFRVPERHPVMMEPANTKKNPAQQKKTAIKKTSITKATIKKP